MSNKLNVTLIQFIKTLSMGMDLISTAVTNHHVRVGFLATRIAHQLGFPATVQRDMLLAGLIHDAGALSFKSRLDALQFEADGVVHSLAGYKLVKPYPKLAQVSKYILYHHTSFCQILESESAIPIEANILNLADRIDVLIKRDIPLDDQIEHICAHIKKHSGTLFFPDYVNAFLELTKNKNFINHAENPLDHLYTLSPERLEDEELDREEILEYSKLFSQVIDFRSPFTATHSRGVAAIAAAMAKLLKFSPEDQNLMIIAGNLHDLGKLAVPESIIEKPGPLDDAEWGKMRNHPRHCKRILADIPGLARISEWACNHHERLDGRGYPEQLSGDQISEGSQIMAVADIFTAITEDRPYRKGMTFKETKNVFKALSNKALRGYIVDIVLENFIYLNEVRINAQKSAEIEFYDLT